MIIAPKEDNVTHKEERQLKTVTIVGSRETDVGEATVLHNGKIAFVGNAARKSDYQGQVYWT